MERTGRLVRVAVAAALVVTACGGGGRERAAPSDARAREVVNLRAFARLYGVVRWFHPSDEAAAADWNAFAVGGVAAVRGAPDRRALDAALEAVVAPIAAGIVIGTPDEVARTPALAVPPGAELVAWQHVGPGFDGGAGPYHSKRTSRLGVLRAGGGWGAFAQTVDAAALRGKRVRLRAELRAGTASRVGAWLRVDRAGGATGFVDSMEDRAVRTAAWQRGTLEGPVAADAERVVVGGGVWGDEGWFDDFVLEVAGADGAWSPVALADADFERGAAAWTAGTGNDSRRGLGYALEVEAGARGASAALHVRAQTQPLVTDPFATRPAEGETVLVELGDGLVARVPIALASVDGHTVPAADARAPSQAPAAEHPGDAAIADVVVAWNVFAHFYPYLDVIATDWHAHLDEALATAIASGGDAAAGLDALRAVIVAAEDGHGYIRTEKRPALLPAVLDLVEDQVVVLASADGALHAGDVVLAIDGVPARAALDRERARQSGSPQWRTHRALALLGRGNDGTVAALDVSRGATTIAVGVARGPRPPLYTYPPLGELEPGLWLVDLSRAAMRDIDAKLDALAAARCVIFDLRGYPNDTHGVLAHLLDEAEHDRWMFTANILRPTLPGQPRPTHEWSEHGWDLAPKAPRLRGKVVFMTGPGAISYAESVMGYVEALGLPIVGAATAGTNGNVRQVALPSGAELSFTGMKVTRHDGARSHLQGIRPTVPVSRTIAGVAAGRDEVLERARWCMHEP